MVIYFLCASLDSESPVIRAGFFLGDSFAYSHNGWWIAQQWRRGYFPDPRTIIKRGSMSNTVSNYDYYNAGLYYVIGDSPLTAMFINCLCGALTALLAYMIAKEVFGRKTARLSSLFCAFWPSLVFWSSQNLKEPVAIFLIGLILYYVIRFRREWNMPQLAVIIAACWVLFWWHKYIAIVVIAAVILSFLFHSKSTIKNIIIFFIVSLLALQFLSAGASSIKAHILEAYPFFKNFTQIEQINYLRSVRTFGETALFATDATTPQRLFSFLFIGFFVVWLVPFPWKLGGSLILTAACPEMLLWYFLASSTLRGLLISFKERWQTASVIVIFLFFGTVMLALVEGNVGTLFRHRALLFPWALILTAAGLARKEETEKLSGID
jgi:4-amino-4-deoxy-L-arabinose transferase-like glycosyltransferase